MYKNIMVPLDGSPLAECVLPHVESLAGGCLMDKVTFVRVVEPLQLAYTIGAEGMIPEKQWQEITRDRKPAAEKYIKKLVNRMKYDKVAVKGEIIEGQPADSLADYATKNGVDLIIISTHGRSGVSRWVWGSVADRILRSACVPVLMVRAPGCVPGI